MSALRLRYLDFARVEFRLVRADGSERPVVVRVGSGPDWRRAISFPSFGTEASESTGDPRLDAAIRERAVEELVRLEAAVRLGDRWGAA